MKIVSVPTPLVVLIKQPPPPPTLIVADLYDAILLKAQLVVKKDSCLNWNQFWLSIVAFWVDPSECVPTE